MTNPIDIDALRQLMEKATAGRWSFEPHGSTTALYSGRGSMRHGLRLMNLDDGDSNFSANASLIVAAVNALPSLLTELEALRASRGRMVRPGWDVDGMCDEHGAFCCPKCALQRAEDCGEVTHG